MAKIADVPNVKTRLYQAGVVLLVLSLAIFIRRHALSFLPYTSDFGFHAKFVEMIASNNLSLPYFWYNRCLDYWFQPPLLYYIFAIVYRLTNIQILDLLTWGLLALDSTVCITTYYLLRKIYKDPIVSVASSFFAFFATSEYEQSFGGGQITTVFALPLIPICLYLLYKTLKQRDLRYSVLTGTVFGITGLIHALTGLYLFTVIHFTLAFCFIKKREKSNLTFILRVWLIILCVFLGLTAVYWFPALLTLKGTLLHFEGTRFTVLAKFPVSVAIGEIWRHSPVALMGRILPISFFCILGLVRVLQRRDLTDIITFTPFITSLFGIFSPYLGFYLTYPYRFNNYLVFSSVLLSGIGVKTTYRYLMKRIRIFTSQRIIAVTMICIILFVSTVRVYRQHTSFEIDPPITIHDRDAMGWIRDNTDENAIIVCDNFHAFWIPYLADKRTINGRSGSELLNSQYDYDVARILCSPNETLKIELLRRYGAEYIYFNKKRFWTTDEDDLQKIAILYRLNVSTAIQRFHNSTAFKVVYENKEVIVFKIGETLEAQIPWERPIDRRWFFLGRIISGLTATLIPINLYLKRKTTGKRNEKT